MEKGGKMKKKIVLVLIMGIFLGGNVKAKDIPFSLEESNKDYAMKREEIIGEEGLVKKILETTGHITFNIHNNKSIYFNCESDAVSSYGLYDNGELVESFEAEKNKTYTTKELPLKTYQLKQLTHGCSETVDNGTHDIVISEDNLHPEITLNVLENIKKIKIVKKAGDNFEENAQFSIGDANKKFNLTTDDKGEAEIKLGYGTYTLKQVSGLKNYTMIPEQVVTIDDNTPYDNIINLKSEEILGTLVVNIKRGEHFYSNCSNNMETTYGIFDEEDNLIDSFLATEEKVYTLNTLSLKKYYIKQISHSCNDKLDGKKYEIDLSKKEKEEVDIEVLENFVDFTITKRYKSLDSDKLTLEKDAVFQIGDEDKTFTITTNSKGNAKVRLGYGTYTIKQISGKKNYALIKPQTITLDENTDGAYKLEVESLEISKSITVVVKDNLGNPIKGAVIGLYKGTKLANKLTTDDEGKVCFANLELRSYIIKELSLPEGYEKEYQTETIELEDDKSITWENKKIKEEVIKEEVQEQDTFKEEMVVNNVAVPDTLVRGEGKIIKFWTLLFTTIFYTIIYKKC